jgi:hypothetical protein
MPHIKIMKLSIIGFKFTLGTVLSDNCLRISFLVGSVVDPGLAFQKVPYPIPNQNFIQRTKKD